MIMKSVFPALLTLLLVGCATTAQPVQKAQKVNVNPERSLDMEALCKA